VDFAQDSRRIVTMCCVPSPSLERSSRGPASPDAGFLPKVCKPSQRLHVSLSLAVLALAVMSAGCFRSKMLNSPRRCAPGDPACNTSTDRDGATDGRRDGTGGNSDLGDGPHDDFADGPRDGFRDGRRDAATDHGDGGKGDGPGDGNRDGLRDIRSDGMADGSRDVWRDGLRDGRLDGRRDGTSDSFVCGSREICGNGIDDDCNGLADCFDRACQNDPSCINRKKEVCDNGIDDDGNGLVDCKDPACFGDRACIVPGKEICNNNLDDDDDGLIDCNDSDCAKDPGCVVNPDKEICDNGKDDNGDGLVDCTDPQCTTFPACLLAACQPEVDFGPIASSGARVTRTISTDGAIAGYSTCATPGGVARVARFSLAAAADVRMDFAQSPGAAHVVALFRAGVGQTCDQNPLDCQRIGDKATATTTYKGLASGTYWLIVQSFPGTSGSTTVTLSTGTAGTTEVCDNGKDDDGDGAIDCADLDCASASNCNLCVPDVNLGTIVIGGGTKSTTIDTTTGSNRYHPTCAGLSTGNDKVIRFSVRETVGLTLSWQQTGDHVYGLFHMPAAGASCDSRQGGCTDMGGRSSNTTNWSYFDPGDYLLIFKARIAGGEGQIVVSLTAFANRGVEICDNDIDDDNDRLVDCDDPDCYDLPICSAPMCVPDGDLGDMDIGTRTTLNVDLTSATQIFQTDCGKGDGRGRAYSINLLSPMVLNFTCTQTGDQVLQISSQRGPLDRCDAHVFTCADPATLPSGCNFGIPNLQPGPYFILIQGFASGTEGTMALTLRGFEQRTLEICNNDIDDDGDGATDCDDRKCVTDPVCTALRCRPDRQLGLLAIDGTPLSTALQTSGAGDDQHKSTCVSAAGGADAVVGFTLPGKTDLTIEWAQVGNHALVLYRSDNKLLACEANTLVACNATSGTATGKNVLKGIDAGIYYLIADADHSGSEGGLILQISGLPSP